MKYFTVIVTLVIIIICIAVYLYLKPGLLQGNAKSPQPTDSAEQAKINQRLDKLDNGIVNLQDILGRQVLHSERFAEKNLFNREQITILEKKFQDTITKLQQILAGNQNLANAPSLLAPVEMQTNLSTSSDSAFSPELFDNPEFTQLFQEQVNEIVKESDKRRQEEQMAQFADRINEMAEQGIDKFAKTQNLDNRQKQELNRLAMERLAKIVELFTKIQTREIIGEEFGKQQSTIRNESNANIKQVLLPRQYEEFQKLELQFNTGVTMIGNLLK